MLAKNKGRTDICEEWNNIEKQLLTTLKPTSIPENITLVRTKIKKKDEWTIYVHGKIDYSTLCEEDFIKSISDYMIFQAKKDLDILDKNLTETELLSAISFYYENSCDE